MSKWIGDDFCDDINNNELCDYDDGDCCGLSAQKNFCYECACKGKLEPSEGSYLIILFPIQNYVCIHSCKDNVSFLGSLIRFVFSFMAMKF